MFSAIRKLERAGDHIKNIAEDIIFYVEAKVLKHKEMKNKTSSLYLFLKFTKPCYLAWLNSVFLFLNEVPKYCIY